MGLFGTFCMICEIFQKKLVSELGVWMIVCTKPEGRYQVRENDPIMYISDKMYFQF